VYVEHFVLPRNTSAFLLKVLFTYLFSISKIIPYSNMSPVFQISGKVKFYGLVLLLISLSNDFKREKIQSSAKLSLKELFKEGRGSIMVA